MKFLKISVYISNLILIIFYLFPGSILGCFFYNDCNIQPEIIDNFFVSFNHLIMFFIVSLLGIFSFKNDFKKISYYLILLSFLLEFFHLIIPNRAYEHADLFGNILGVIISLILYKFLILRRLK